MFGLAIGVYLRHQIMYVGLQLFRSENSHCVGRDVKLYGHIHFLDLVIVINAIVFFGIYVRVKYELQCTKV